MRDTNVKKVVKSGLSADDIVKILAACKESGVSKLVFSGLNVSMVPEPRPETTTSLVPEPSAEAMQTMAALSEKGIQRDELLYKEQTLDELLIEDPLEYERLQRQKELEDAPAES